MANIDLGRNDNPRPSGDKSLTKVVIGIGGIITAGIVSYYVIKNVSSTLANFGNGAQMIINSCSSTLTVERASYLGLFYKYVTETGGNPTPAQLADLNTVQALISSTAASCSAELANFCKQNPKECPTNPIDAMANTAASGFAIGEIIAMAAIPTSIGAVIYKRYSKAAEKNPKSTLTGSNDTANMKNATAQAQAESGNITPEEAGNYEQTMTNEAIKTQTDFAQEATDLNEIVGEEVITAAEESTIATALTTEYQTTIDDFIALE